MNIHKMITELQAEKERLDEAISALERLSAGSKSRRRPARSATLTEPASEDASTQADVPHSRSR